MLWTDFLANIFGFQAVTPERSHTPQQRKAIHELAVTLLGKLSCKYEGLEIRCIHFTIRNTTALLTPGPYMVCHLTHFFCLSVDFFMDILQDTQSEVPAEPKKGKVLKNLAQV